ncbi:hypothetical protein LXL04_008746 [Taraxacum kok-saghyz]
MQSLAKRQRGVRQCSRFFLDEFKRRTTSLSSSSNSSLLDHSLTCDPDSVVLVEGNASSRTVVLNRPSFLNALNTAMGPGGQLKLADFGLARIFGCPDRRFTHQGNSDIDQLGKIFAGTRGIKKVTFSMAAALYAHCCCLRFWTILLLYSRCSKEDCCSIFSLNWGYYGNSDICVISNGNFEDKICDEKRDWIHSKKDGVLKIGGDFKILNFFRTRGHFWHTFDVWQPGVCIEFWHLKASRVINCIIFWKICYKNCGFLKLLLVFKRSSLILNAEGSFGISGYGRAIRDKGT